MTAASTAPGVSESAEAGSSPSSASARATSARRISAETSTGVTSRSPGTRKRTTRSASPPTSWYGTIEASDATSAGALPMNRLTDEMVSSGRSAARRRAASPTSTSPGPAP